MLGKCSGFWQNHKAHLQPSNNLDDQIANNPKNVQLRLGRGKREDLEAVLAWYPANREARQRLEIFHQQMSPAEADLAGFKVSTPIGRLEHGTILYYGQTHNREEFKNSPILLKQVAQSQQSILDDLMNFRPQHIFAEGLYGEIKVGDVHWTTAHFRAQNFIREVFEGYQAGQLLTPNQQELILEKSAAWIYFYLHTNVTLHGTTTEEANKRHNAYMSKHLSRLLVSGMTSEDQEIIFEQREKLAIQCLQKFLVHHPQQVALIYGSQHNFAQYCNEPNFSPQFYSKDLSFSQKERTHQTTLLIKL